MESTGRYHEPIRNVLFKAGLFVCTVNPHLIKNYGNNTIRKVKTDSTDAKKIARYTLDNWAELREYTSMDTTRTQLKTLNSQFSFFMKQKTAAKTNLIALLDTTYPGVNKLFDSPVRADGSEKWVDFAYSFWHVDCVRKAGITAFTDRYKRFCKHHGYEFQEAKANAIYKDSKELIATLPKEAVYKELIQESIRQLNLLSENVEHISYGWMIFRAAFPWASKRRTEIKSLSFTMEQRSCRVPGPHFKTHAPGDSFSFTHPVSGTKYTLTVQELERQTISEKRFGSDRWFYPTYFTAMSYTLSPEPDSDISICDCAEGDKPLEIAPCSDRYAPEARNDMACIGIIGGADGPTAIVCGGSSKEKLHAACSALHFEPVEGDIEWRIVFNIKNSNEMSLELI